MNKKAKHAQHPGQGRQLNPGAEGRAYFLLKEWLTKVYRQPGKVLGYIKPRRPGL